MRIQQISVLTAGFLALVSTSLSAQPFTDLALSQYLVCGLMDTGEVECATSNREVSPERYAPPADLPPMTAISSGGLHFCGINFDGDAICWGGGVVNSLKESYPFGYYEQLKVPLISAPLSSIASGVHHSCAVDTNNRAWCWGLNTNGQTDVPGDGLGSEGQGYLKLDAGNNFTCGILLSGNIECWSTDESVATIGVIEGPFVDLDIDAHRGGACGLKEDGSIDCWVGQNNTPSNGPYTDFVVNSTGVCALNLNQNLDCKGVYYEGLEEPVLDGSIALTKIESAMSSYGSPTRDFCGLSTDGDMVCSKFFNDYFELPGTMTDFSKELSDVVLPFTARRYAKNQIELLWPSQPLRYGNEQLQFEIYRDDVLVDTTLNSNSWYDGSVQAGNPVSYKIRAINARGSVGPFSTTITVDNVSGGISQGEGAITEFDIVTPSQTIDALNLRFLGNTPYIIWSGPTPGQNGVKGYEVRIDNEVVSYNDGFSYVYNNYNRFSCSLISVAMMSFDDKIIDYRTMVLNRTGRNYSCLPD